MIFKIVIARLSACRRDKSWLWINVSAQNGTAQESAPAGAVIGMFGVTGKQGRVRCRG
jgi:hypothetical protein